MYGSRSTTTLGAPDLEYGACLQRETEVPFGSLANVLERIRDRILVQHVKRQRYRLLKRKCVVEPPGGHNDHITRVLGELVVGEICHLFHVRENIAKPIVRLEMADCSGYWEVGVMDREEGCTADREKGSTCMANIFCSGITIDISLCCRSVQGLLTHQRFDPSW